MYSGVFDVIYGGVYGSSLDGLNGISNQHFYSAGSCVETGSANKRGI